MQTGNRKMALDLTQGILRQVCVVHTTNIGRLDAAIPAGLNIWPQMWKMLHAQREQADLRRCKDGLQLS